ncbi:MAG: threonylcarbamoyl-AMP synthase [Ruminococcus sp.]|jgi:L-threonylcarbamoyladenylate synthase|nr:threonylcarbamoyl-AMP synthase [Ruminococcus sp.]
MTKHITRVVPCDENGLAEAAEIIKSGGIVAMPTETVYGLAANALDPKAVENVFLAKGRPADNPLIVHLSDISQVADFAADVPKLAYRLFERFSPGPLTIVLKKKSVIPDITSGGLDTVGIRIPGDKNCRRLIELSGVPIAAPSANISGKPSPTTAAHVYDDLCGEISLILDGGACSVGIESTVVSFEEGKIRILRPGFVTAEDLSEFGEVITDSGVLENVSETDTPKSPGMKYKHYAPDCDVFLVNGDTEKFANFCAEQNNNGEDIAVLINKNDIPLFVDTNIPLTEKDSRGQLYIYHYGETEEDFARNLFLKLRKIDKIEVSKAYIQMPEKTGIGLAVYNRIIRAAGFKTIDL